VCAIGVCFREGAECTRCHGRNTLPGVRLNCRGNRAEAAAYGLSLALWQRRVLAQADAVIVPSAFARERLRLLGAPLPWERVRVLAPPLRPPRQAGGDARRSPGQQYALVVSRLAPEKGLDVAIDACRLAGIALVIAGEGPELSALRSRAGKQPVRFVGRVQSERLAELRAGAAIALAPSRSAETFGLAAAEAMAAGVPVAASRIGALPELVGEEGLVAANDANAMAQAIARLAGDRAAGERARLRVGELCAPEVVAGALARVYEEATGGDAGSDRA
jgi:glycosyltransferase involved in cell wall biosynthesis